MTLINNDLKSSDPTLAPLCKRLERFRPMLKGRTIEEASVRTLLKNGFKAVRFKPNPGASEEAEVLRLLDGLADKLGGMAKMMGGMGGMFS